MSPTSKTGDFPQNLVQNYLTWNKNSVNYHQRWSNFGAKWPNFGAKRAQLQKPAIAGKMPKKQHWLWRLKTYCLRKGVLGKLRAKA